MAPRRSGAVLDQLPQARRAAVGSPSGDLQPGTQRNQAASSGSARPAPESVVPAQGAASLPGNPRPPFSTVAARNVGLSNVLNEVLEDVQNEMQCSDMHENDMEIDNGEDEAEVEAVEALLTLQRLRLSGRLSASKRSALAKPLGLVVQPPRLPRSVPMCDFDTSA